MNIHAVSHSVPHRGPGASRARTRWQPYAPTISLSGIQRSPTSSYLHTPAYSSASSSPSTVLLHPTCDVERSKLSQTPPPPLAAPLRDTQKTKYAAKLVDQAVKTLCESWRPDDIPTLFTACGREALCVQPELATPSSQCLPPPTSCSLSTLFACRNTQLPSPVSPTSHQTPSPTGEQRESYAQAPEGPGSSNLVPIKGFVHEVLRRSRTSTGVLQTALCYLEAVRSKVPELLRMEKARPTSESIPEQQSEPRIVSGLFDSSTASTGLPPLDAPDSHKTAELNVHTVRIGNSVLVSDLDADMQQPTPAPSTCDKEQSSLPPLPTLPSPLCCPRRTFLACLILASKFMQDRSYSNRAWAKLAGLPPREIGRCERALGEALEWRLWVGKLPATSSSRAVSRSRSDGDLLCGATRTCSSTSTAFWAAPPTAGVAAPASSSSYARPIPPAPVPAPSLRTRCLQRSATVPAVGTGRSSLYADSMAFPLFNGNPYFYDSSSAPGTGFDMASAMDVEPLIEVSPSLSTPTLCDSPMSSSSSSSDGSEERTIQMSTYTDLQTPSLSTFASCSNPRGPWVANLSSYASMDPANFRAIPGPLSYNPYYNVSNTLDLDLDYATERRSVVGPTLVAINPTVSKQHIITSLPPFSEAFPESCLGTIGTGMQ